MAGPYVSPRDLFLAVASIPVISFGAAGEFGAVGASILGMMTSLGGRNPKMKSGEKNGPTSKQVSSPTMVLYLDFA